MAARTLLTEGLVISRDGLSYELRRRIGSRLQFETIQTGEIIDLTEASFFDELQSRRVVIIPVASTEKELALHPDQLERPYDPPRVMDLSEIENEKAKADLMLRIRYILHMRRLGISRGCLDLLKDEIPRAASDLKDEKPPAASTLSRWMRIYADSNDDPYSLLDRRAIPAERKRRSSEHQQIIDDILEEQYLCTHSQPVSSIYHEYEQRLRTFNQSLVEANRPIEIKISERTLYRIVGELDRYEVLVAQHGRAEARRKCRLIKGHLPADYPLEYVEIDHSLVDLFVIDDQLFIPLGRPWITIIRDRFSGAIIGLYISFSGPRVDSIFGALRHSIYPHTNTPAFFHDIENQLPWGLATTYVTDRGADFLSERYRLAVLQLGSHYEYCAARTPWFKGPVERFFRELSYLLETMPGKTFPRLDLRKDYDPAKHAVVRFSSFVWILYKWVCDIYNNSLSERKHGRPLDLFNEGIEKVPRVFPHNPEVVETLLGTRHSGSLRHDGVRKHHLHYGNSTQLADLFRWKGGKSSKVTFHLNENDLGQIRVLDPRTREFFPVPSLRPEYAEGLSLLQHNLIKDTARRNYGDKITDESLWKARELIQAQIVDELERKSTSPKKQLARYAGINSNQVIAGESSSIITAVEKPVSAPSDPGDSSDLGPSITTKPSFGWSVL